MIDEERVVGRGEESFSYGKVEACDARDERIVALLVVECVLTVGADECVVNVFCNDKGVGS